MDKFIERYHHMNDNGDLSYRTNGDDDTSPMIGFELEIANPNSPYPLVSCCSGEEYDEDSDYYEDDDYYFEDCEDCAREIHDKLCSRETWDALFHTEEDCSLNHGFEIISQPLTEDWAMSNLDKLKELLDICVSHGFKSHDAKCCGLHMHMDREFFGNRLDSSIAKMLYIFDKHWENLSRFSRRSSGHWCHRYDLSGTDTIKDIIKDQKCGCIDRYFAINLSNSNTIEVRLWRGTLKWETFLATLKFTYRFMHLCKDVSARDIVKMSWEEILGDDPDILAYWETVKDRRLANLV